jgi:hypothetical protein
MPRNSLTNFAIDQPTSPQLTHCGHGIVKRIIMFQSKATEELAPLTIKESKTLKYFVYHMAARNEAKV